MGVYGQSKLRARKLFKKWAVNFISFEPAGCIRISVTTSSYHEKIKSEQEEIKVVSDQVGVPTSNQFLAEQVQQIIPKLNKNNTGIYHLVPDGSCSWYEFAKVIITNTNPQFNLENLYSIQTHEFPTKTKRPKNSILNNAKIKQTFNLELNNWQTGLERIIDEA